MGWKWYAEFEFAIGKFIQHMELSFLVQHKTLWFSNLDDVNVRHTQTISFNLN